MSEVDRAKRSRLLDFIQHPSAFGIRVDGATFVRLQTPSLATVFFVFAMTRKRRPPVFNSIGVLSCSIVRPDSERHKVQMKWSSSALRALQGWWLKSTDFIAGSTHTPRSYSICAKLSSTYRQRYIRLDGRLHRVR